jgi:hypothetical protein
MTAENIMTIEKLLLPIILTSLAGGGLVATLIKSFFDRKKNKAEITNIQIDGADKLVESALKLEGMATQKYIDEAKKYADCMKKLEFAERLMQEVKDELRETRNELEKERKYSAILQVILEDNNLSYPDRSGVI